MQDAQIAQAVFKNDIRYFYNWLDSDSPAQGLDYDIHYDVTQFRKITRKAVIMSQSVTEWVDLISYCEAQVKKGEVHTLINFEKEYGTSFETDQAFYDFVCGIMLANKHGDMPLLLSVGDAIAYLKTYAPEWEYSLDNRLTVRVGTDSQFYGGKSHYAVVVAFDFGGRNGVHAIHKKVNETLVSHTFEDKKVRRKRKKGSRSRKNDIAIQERLNRETFFSLAVAYFIREHSGIVCDIDLDYNSKLEMRFVEENGKTIEKLVPMHLSGKVVQQNIGMCKGLGFEVRLKPDTLIATPYADKLCR